MNATTTDQTIHPGPASHATCKDNSAANLNSPMTGHTGWRPSPVRRSEKDEKLAAALRSQLESAKSMDSAATNPAGKHKENSEASDVDLERTKAPGTQMVLAPTAQHDITRDMLTPGPKLDAFGQLIIRCAVDNQEFFELARQHVNVDARSAKATLNDFFHPMDSLIFAAMDEFFRTASPGTQRPTNSCEWSRAIQPHLDYFFEKHPEYPVSLKSEATKHILALCPTDFDHLDRACDGLIDYVRGVRLHKAEAETAKADPATKLATIHAVESSIRLPGSIKRWQGLKDLGEFEATPYLVDDLLIEGTASMLYGPPGDGKTFLALDIGSSVATGREWNGMHTERGGVLYYCLEGGTGFRNRMLALKRRGLLRDEDPFEFCTEALDLRSPDVHTRILNDIKANEARFKMKVKLIVIDTLAAATSGGNECTSEDMGTALHQVNEVVKASGATALLLHHPGKDVSRGPRGWSGIVGNLDTIIETDKVSKELRTATVKKQKDGEEGQVFNFGLEIVTLGRNPLGKPVTSCIVKHFTVEEAGKAAGDDPDGMVRLLWRDRPDNDVVDTKIVCKLLGIAGKGGALSTRASNTMKLPEIAGLVTEAVRGANNIRQWQLTPKGKEVVRDRSECP